MPGLSSIPAADGLPGARRWVAVLALSLGVCVSVLVNSMVTVVLPVLAGRFGVSAGAAVWLVNTFQLAVAVALLPVAAWGARVGHLRVYRLGLALFVLASLACALAPSFAWLLAARLLQGLGVAGIMAMNTALLRMAYPQAHLGRGVGLNGTVVAVSAAAGPTLGGALLALASWPALFCLLAVLAGLSLLIGWQALADAPRAPGPSRFDAVGALLQAGAIIGLVVGLSRFGQAGATGTGLAGAAGLVFFALAVGTWFVRRERRRAQPLLPLDLLRQPLFALSFGASFCAFLAQMLALVTLPFYLHLAGFGPSRIGLLMTPWPLAMAVVAPLAGALSDRWPAGLLGSVGLTLSATGLALLAGLPEAGVASMAVAWRVGLCGVGFALFTAPNIRTLVAAAPPQRSAVVGAMTALSRQLGQTFGAALAGMLLGLSAAAAGSWCFAAAAGIALVAAGLSLLRLRGA